MAVQQIAVHFEDLDIPLTYVQCILRPKEDSPAAGPSEISWRYFLIPATCPRVKLFVCTFSGCCGCSFDGIDPQARDFAEKSGKIAHMSVTTLDCQKILMLL
jgi:hypothetical protein